MPISKPRLDPANPGNLAFPQIGTIDAIYNNSKSARHVDGKHGSTGWGGARNKADRTSDGLTVKQATGILRAVQSAWAIGLPFNRHVTVHLERVGVADRGAARAIGALLTAIRDWLRKAGYQTAWAWVRENGACKGSHVHILLHIPAGLCLTFQRSRRWLERITGNRYRAGTIRTKRIGGTINAMATPGLYRVNLENVVSYVLKGALPDTILALGLVRHEPGGRIIGKRAGWSQNVGTGSL